MSQFPNWKKISFESQIKGGEHWCVFYQIPPLTWGSSTRPTVSCRGRPWLGRTRHSSSASPHAGRLQESWLFESEMKNRRPLLTSASFTHPLVTYVGWSAHLCGLAVKAGVVARFANCLQLHDLESQWKVGEGAVPGAGVAPSHRRSVHFPDLDLAGIDCERTERSTQAQRSTSAPGNVSPMSDRKKNVA